jgi:hypothetical protein
MIENDIFSVSEYHKKVERSLGLLKGENSDAQ